jgi:hypothetical protein
MPSELRRLDIRDIVRSPKFRLAAMEDAAYWAKANVRAGYVTSARMMARDAAHEARAILARRELFARVIVATQAREGITTTMDQARAAYDHHQKED